MQKIITNRNINIDKELLKDFNDESVTIIHITVNPPVEKGDGWWINLNPKCFLRNYQSVSNSLPLLHAFNIEIAPALEYIQPKFDSKKFTLIFPAIPMDWEEFDLYEYSEFAEPVEILNIPRVSSCIYNIVLD